MYYNHSFCSSLLHILVFIDAIRQLSKEGLQSIVDDKEEVNSLSSKDLRQLFKFNESTISDTHEKLECERCPQASAKEP